MVSVVAQQADVDAIGSPDHFVDVDSSPAPS
jgi:hypothetical protein